jgi:hypothetical protein
VIGGQEEGEGKTYQGKHYQDLGIKISLGYTTKNPQGKKQSVDRTNTVQHGKDKQHLGYTGLLLPKFQELFHENSSKLAAAEKPPPFKNRRLLEAVSKPHFETSFLF